MYTAWHLDVDRQYSSTVGVHVFGGLFVLLVSDKIHVFTCNAGPHLTREKCYPREFI